MRPTGLTFDGRPAAFSCSTPSHNMHSANVHRGTGMYKSGDCTAYGQSMWNLVTVTGRDEGHSRFVQIMKRAFFHWTASRTGAAATASAPGNNHNDVRAVISSTILRGEP